MEQDYSDFFPYEEFKPLQINAMDFVSEVVESKTIGLFEAYCGFGKTIATFAPVLAAGKKILLLTPTYSARNAATAEALKINKVKGKKIRIADLRGKQVMCRKFEKDFFSHEACLNAVKYKKDCEYYSNTFSKNRMLSKEASSTISNLQRTVTENPQKFFGSGLIEKEPLFFQAFQKTCDSKGLCSYEIMKKMIEEADIVILDYFWCFTGIFHILKKLINPKEFVLLVDEADMLVERLYTDFQVQLGLQGLQRLSKQAGLLLSSGELQETDIEFLSEFIRHASEFIQKNNPERPLEPQVIIDFFVKKFRENAREQGLEGNIGFETIIENLSTVAEAISGSEEFEKASARPDIFLAHLEKIKNSSEYLSFISKAKNRIIVKPFEINSIVLANGMTLYSTLKEFQSAILFSATLGDSVLFQKELGLNPEETKIFKAASMPHKNLLVLIDTELDSTYKARDRNFFEYIEKIKAIRQADNSLLVSCCNSFEAEKILKELPFLENAEQAENLLPEKTYVLNIRTKHARSTNKAKRMRNCIIIGLPLPDYSDFYFKQRKDYLEKKYGKSEAGRLINGKAVHTAVQLMGRITRDLTSPKTITLADRRYVRDFFLGDFYFKSIPDYLKPYIKTVDSTQKLKMEIRAFWQNAKMEQD
ncbi:MAG: helicase C-terminal domain-containing protein [Candidatus ainarchaeum sp.]|nr:helicase C-terminal domain-containing protein [Candidatus ainarchaeum sp.]